MCASWKNKSHGHDGNVFLFMIDCSFFFLQGHLEFAIPLWISNSCVLVGCWLLVVVKETVFLPDPIILFLKWITYSDQIKPCWNNCRSPPFFSFFLSPIHTFFVLILPSSTQKTENYKETPNLIKAYSTQTFQHFLFW